MQKIYFRRSAGAHWCGAYIVPQTNNKLYWNGLLPQTKIVPCSVYNQYRIGRDRSNPFQYNWTV